MGVSRNLFKQENLKTLITNFHVFQKKAIDFIKEHRTVKMLHVFRSYSAFFVVISSAILVSATNLASGKESSGFLFGYLGSESSDQETIADLDAETNSNRNLALAPVPQTRNVPDPSIKEGDEEELVIMQGQALVAGTSPVRKDPMEDGGVIVYEVQQGDTVSGIAAKYKVTTNTILWANAIDNVDQISPGDKIFILPIPGLRYTVKNGDNIDKIAEKYKSTRDKIISYNELPANGELTVGDEIIIPDGQKEIPKNTNQQSTGVIAARQYESFTPSGKTTTAARAGAGHKFPYGYCTWYVAQKKYVPWGGNAGTWLYHAKAMGYSTGRSPRVGSIMVTSESWWGHVALVEKVNGDMITVSEMNYKGWAKKSYRTLSSKSRVIKGFIY
jgi:surface antigen